MTSIEDRSPASGSTTETGELERTRVAAADRAAVRKFLRRFRGRELEVALEAATGWRFVVEEQRRQRVGAVVHLAEPAERRAQRPQKRAKTIGRTPGIRESC